MAASTSEPAPTENGHAEPAKENGEQAKADANEGESKKHEKPVDEPADDAAKKQKTDA